MHLDEAHLSKDALLAGALTLWQPARGRGYRFNLDPVLLAGFVAPAHHVLDLGAGCGVVGLLLLAMNKARRLTAVELQPELAALTRRNVAENGFSACAEVLEGDLRSLQLGSVDCVVFNPPYFAAEHGRPAQGGGRDAGRHERNGTLSDFVRCAAGALAPDGSLAAIVPVQRDEELVAAWQRCGGVVTRRREVVARAGLAAGHVLLEGRRTGALVIEPPLVVHEGAGRDYSPEVRELLRR